MSEDRGNTPNATAMLLKKLTNKLERFKTVSSARGLDAKQTSLLHELENDVVNYIVACHKDGAGVDDVIIDRLVHRVRGTLYCELKHLKDVMPSAFVD